MSSPPFSVALPLYDGPLDLLLDLIRRQELHIEDIPVAVVASQFLAYLEDAKHVNIDLNADWMEMAARLILLKSRCLLPRDPELSRGEPDARAELVELLRKHAAEAVEALASRKRSHDASLSRNAVAESPPNEPEEPVLFTLWDLIELCEDHARDSRLAAPMILESEAASLEEILSWIRNRWETAGSVGALMAERAVRAEKICIFLGILDLAKEKTFDLRQENHFGPIFIMAAS